VSFGNCEVLEWFARVARVGGWRVDCEGRGLRSGEVPTSGIEIGVFEEATSGNSEGSISRGSVELWIVDVNEVEDMDVWWSRWWLHAMVKAEVQVIVAYQPRKDNRKIEKRPREMRRGGEEGYRVRGRSG
jgi:hypothetical protein